MDARSAQFFTDSAPPSPKLMTALGESMRRSEQLYPLIPTSYPGSMRVQFATRWLLLALEHRESLLLLVHQNRRSSAYALMRPIYEAWARGFWASSAANEAQISAMSERRYLPKLDTVVRDLNRVLDASISEDASEANPELQRGAITRSKALLWQSLSDYTHGGLRQLARWGEPDGTIAPAHTDEEMIWNLRMVDVWGVTTCAVLFDAAGVALPDVVPRLLHELAALRFES